MTSYFSKGEKMTLEDRMKILSNDYANVIVDYNRKDRFTKQFEGFPLNILDERIDDKYAVYYIPYADTTLALEWENEYASTPKLYGLLDTINLDAMGVGKVQNVPQLGLKGEGVLLGFVDTGIDYTNSAFRNVDGTSRIVSIWDQTIENLEASQNIFYYGTEYSKEQINNALQNEDPFSIVPSKDDIGHGTMLAGIAGGTRDETNDFQGVVPLSEFVVVKLKQAKQNIRNHFLVPEDVTCFQEDDIMFGIQYLANTAQLLNRPIVICIGLGTTQGGHDAEGVLSDYMAFTGNRVGICFIIAAGNEGSSKNHYYGVIDPNIGYNEVELLIGGGEKGFAMELWGFPPNTYTIDILSPGGQYVSQIEGRLGVNRKIEFLFENTVVYVDYLLVESQSGSPLILIRFENPAQGMWRFRVYSRGSKNANFHIWLPLTGFISRETFFINANPDTTITSPGNAPVLTTVTAYDAVTNVIYINSSRGYTRDNYVKPDIAAPGVNVLAPMPGVGNNYTRVSGTSVAAAHTVGLAAMIFEWGIVREFYETLGSLQIQRFLIRGVERDPSLSYPNKVWGYGKVNIYNTFLSLSTSIEN